MRIKARGQYAVFQDRDFELECHNDGYWLIGDDPNDGNLGFVPASGVENRFVMRGIDLNPLSFVFERATYAYYDGYKFPIPIKILMLPHMIEMMIIKFITRIGQERIPCTPPIRPLRE